MAISIRSDPDYFIGSGPDPGYFIGSDPDPGYCIGSDPDPGFFVGRIRTTASVTVWCSHWCTI